MVRLEVANARTYPIGLETRGMNSKAYTIQFDTAIP